MESKTKEKLLIAQSKSSTFQPMGMYSLVTGVPSGGGPSTHEHQHQHHPPHGEEEEFEVGHVMVMW